VAQPVNISINISPLHIVAAVFISQILFKDKFMEVVGRRLNDIIDTAYAVGKNVVVEFPVTVLATGLTFGLHQLTPYAPALVLSTEGSMKVAAFVGGVFALKSALYPVLEKLTEHKKNDKKDEGITHATMIRNSVVLHFFPLALGAAYAFYAQVPVKLAQSALYTAALIPVVKLVGKGIDSFCEMEGVKERIEGWYAWMNLEKPE
jgi:hypothetical protein